MAGKLVKVQTNTISTATNTVDLIGTTTDNVYLLTLNNIYTSVDASVLLRFTVSGSPDSTANYDKAQKNLRGDSTFSNISATNETSSNLGSIGTGTGEIMNGIIHIFNANDSNEFTMLSTEMSIRNNQGHLRGFQGGGMLTKKQSTDGVRLINDSGNFTSGTFSLFKVL